MGLLLLFHCGRCHLCITKTTINTAKCESVELRGKAPHPELRLLRAELCQSLGFLCFVVMHLCFLSCRSKPRQQTGASLAQIKVYAGITGLPELDLLDRSTVPALGLILADIA